MDEQQHKTMSEITTLYAKETEFENEIASDDLKFSLWIAAVATAGFGLMLLNADKLATASWLGRSIALYVILGVQVILAASLVATSVMHYLVNFRLRLGREYINLLNSQIAIVL